MKKRMISLVTEICWHCSTIWPNVGDERRGYRMSTWMMNVLSKAIRNSNWCITRPYSLSVTLPLRPDNSTRPSQNHKSSMAGGRLEVFKFTLYVLLPGALVVHLKKPEWYTSYVEPVCQIPGCYVYLQGLICFVYSVQTTFVPSNGDDTQCRWDLF